MVPNCTILFSDVVGFTSTCSQLAPMEVVSLLNTMYTKFDKALEKHKVYKVRHFILDYTLDVGRKNVLFRLKQSVMPT